MHARTSRARPHPCTHAQAHPPTRAGHSRQPVVCHLSRVSPPTRDGGRPAPPTSVTRIRTAPCHAPPPLPWMPARLRTWPHAAAALRSGSRAGGEGCAQVKQQGRWLEQGRWRGARRWRGGRGSRGSGPRRRGPWRASRGGGASATAPPAAAAAAPPTSPRCCRAAPARAPRNQRAGGGALREALGPRRRDWGGAVRLRRRGRGRASCVRPHARHSAHAPEPAFGPAPALQGKDGRRNPHATRHRPGPAGGTARGDP